MSEVSEVSERTQALTSVVTDTFLKGIMTDAIVQRGECTDFNTCWGPGVHYVRQQTLNFPPGMTEKYGNLIVVSGGYNFSTQIYLPNFGSENVYTMAIRAKANDIMHGWFYFKSEPTS